MGGDLRLTILDGRCRDCRHCISFDHRHKTWVRCRLDGEPYLQTPYEVACPRFEEKERRKHAKT